MLALTPASQQNHRSNWWHEMPIAINWRAFVSLLCFHKRTLFNNVGVPSPGKVHTSVQHNRGTNKD